MHLPAAIYLYSPPQTLLCAKYDIDCMDDVFQFLFGFIFGLFAFVELIKIKNVILANCNKYSLVTATSNDSRAVTYAERVGAAAWRVTLSMTDE